MLRAMKTLFLVLGLLSSFAMADERPPSDKPLPPSFDVGNVPLPKSTVQALTEAALAQSPVAEELQLRLQHPVGIDYGVDLPEALKARLFYDWKAPIQVGVGVSTTGAHVGVSADVTVHVLWWTDTFRNFNPIIQLEFSHLTFTGLADTFADKAVQNVYGDKLKVILSGSSMDTVSLEGGFNWDFKKVWRLSGSFGILRQVGDTEVEAGHGGKIRLWGLTGPSGKLMIGRRFK